jgi:putative transposase
MVAWVEESKPNNYNLVGYRLVRAPKDWEYFSFQKYVREGKYDVMWGADTSLQIEDGFD